MYKRQRLARQAYHYQQLVNLLQQPGIEEIHILSMEYDHRYVGCQSNSLRLPHPRIIYHDHPLVPPGQARNQLIKMFNETDQDWALFLDNDTVIDYRIHGMDIITTIEKNKEILNAHCDVIMPLVPRHQAWGRYVDDNKERISTHIPLFRANYMKSSLFWLKNQIRSGREPILFSEELKELEDWEYVPRVLSQGGSIWAFKTVLIYEFNPNIYSTLFAGENTSSQLANRAKNRQDIQEEQYKKYISSGAYKSSKGKYVWKNMVKNTSPRELWLPIDQDVFGNGLFEI